MPSKKHNLSRKRGRKEETQQDEVEDDGEDEEELLLSSRQKRTRERQKKVDSEKHGVPESQEMTEDEMMHLALQLSKQEANSAAQRQHQEEEDMKKAIEESMISQTQPCLPPLSLSPSADVDAIVLPSKRKLLYVDGTDLPAMEDCTARGGCSVVPGLRGAGDHCDNVKRKRKREEGSPLPEMPDLSQTQIIYSQASPFSLHSLSAPSPPEQDSDVTQNDLSQLCKSPVFPLELTSRACKVVIPKLTQELLEASSASGTALCSQRSVVSSQNDLPSLATSPTFPKSPAFPRTSILSDTPKIPGSPVLSETEERDVSEIERSPSPVFGGTSVCQRTRRMRNKTAAPSAPDDGKSSSEETSPSRSNHRLTSFSQENKDPLQCLKRGKAMAHSEDSTEFSLNHSGKIATPSKLVSEEELNEIPEQQNTVTLELTSDMTLHWSDEEDRTQSEDRLSPVFPQEGPLRQADSHQERLSPEALSPSSSPKSHCSISLCQPRPPESNDPPTASPERDPRLLQSQAATSSGPIPTAEQGAQGRVHYYWGVPFCPRGLEPDMYTKVILCQMEVYEKSLKLAQRGLLQKAEWGEPILPQPKKPSLPVSTVESSFLHVTRRPGLRMRGRRAAKAFCSPSPEGEEDEEEDEEEEKEKKTVEEEKGEEDGNTEDEMKTKETLDVTSCEVCPETELSDDADSTQDLMVTNSGLHQLCPLPQRQPVAPVQPVQPQHPHTEEDELMEVDVPVDGDSDRNSLAPSPARAPEAGKEAEGPAGGRMDSEAEEGSDEVVHVSDSPEPAPLAASEDPNVEVECPICQSRFPMVEIELHAAYCDGHRPEEEEPDDYLNRVSLRPRRLKTRVREADEENVDNVPAQKTEKCFICQKVVSLRDYKKHTDNCLRHQSSNTPMRGDLMSALEQTESKDSEVAPSCSTFTSKSGHRAVVVIDCDDEPEPGGSGDGLGFSVSTSPIRSFTSISEAKDCVIDFKNQYSGKQQSQKGGRKRALKRFRR